MSIINNLSYWFNGTEHLQANAPEKNLAHLADLVSPTQERVALLASSVKLAAEGEPHPITNVTNSFGEGVWNGFRTILGAVVVPSVVFFDNLSVENDSIFCPSFMLKVGGKKAFNALIEGNLTTAAQITHEGMKLTEQCMENSTSFRAMAFLTPGLEFVSEYKWPLLMVTTAVAIGTLIMHHRYLENTQAQARDKLYTQLYDTYDRTATQLVFQFEQAKMENDPQAMEACRQIARKIQGNLEYIKLDLAKCEKSLSTQEQDQIVSKVTEALDYVLKNSES